MTVKQLENLNSKPMEAYAASYAASKRVLSAVLSGHADDHSCGVMFWILAQPIATHHITADSDMAKCKDGASLYYHGDWQAFENKVLDCAGKLGIESDVQILIDTCEITG